MVAAIFLGAASFGGLGLLVLGCVFLHCNYIKEKCAKPSDGNTNSYNFGPV